MRTYIALILGLHTPEQTEARCRDAREETERRTRAFYRDVTKKLQKGFINLPKESVIIRNHENGDIIAQDGVWQRQPHDGEIVRITYKKHE